MQERGPVAPVNAGRQRYVLVGGVAAAVVAADQLTKWWAVDRLSRGPITIVGSIRLALTHNSGGAFGLGSGVVPMVVLAVIDFVDLQWWPVFNVADAAITCGCVVLILLSFRRVPAESDS